MFLLAFSFANFETTREDTGKANLHCPKKVSPQFSKFANEKARRNFIWGVYMNAQGRRKTFNMFKVVLEGYPRCPDSHDLNECHHLYDTGKAYIAALIRPLL